MPSERARNALTVTGIALLILGPFAGDPLLFRLRELLVQRELTDPNQGFCSAVWALTCSVYGIFGFVFLGLTLIVASLVWWLVERNRVVRISR